MKKSKKELAKNLKKSSNFDFAQEDITTDISLIDVDTGDEDSEYKDIEFIELDGDLKGCKTLTEEDINELLWAINADIPNPYILNRNTSIGLAQIFILIDLINSSWTNDDYTLGHWISKDAIGYHVMKDDKKLFFIGCNIHEDDYIFFVIVDKDLTNILINRLPNGQEIRVDHQKNYIYKELDCEKIYLKKTIKGQKQVLKKWIDTILGEIL